MVEEKKNLTRSKEIHVWKGVPDLDFVFIFGQEIIQGSNVIPHFCLICHVDEFSFLRNLIGKYMSNENLTEDVLEKKLQCTSNDLQNKIEGLGNANKLRALLLPFCFGETETERRDPFL